MAVKVRNQTSASGIVKMYTPNRFGFIAADDGGNDIFVTHRAVENAGLQDRMAKGLRLTFDLVPENNGRRGCYAAVNLAPVETLDDPAARIEQLENAIRQLFAALPEEARTQMRALPTVADIVDAEHTPTLGPHMNLG